MQINLQDFKKKSFSTLEILFFIVLISAIISFFAPKIGSILERNDLIKLKSDIALIRNAIQKESSKRALKGDFDTINRLDSAGINQAGDMLFEDILDYPIVSTSTKESKNGSWVKNSSSSYIFFMKKNSYEFKLKNGEFICESGEALCKDLL